MNIIYIYIYLSKDISGIYLLNYNYSYHFETLTNGNKIIK